MTVTPSSQRVDVSQTAKFTATASGVGEETFTYQWKRRGVDIQGETESTLNITNVTKSDGGTYECIVTNEYGDRGACSVELKISSKQTRNLKET